MKLCKMNKQSLLQILAICVILLAGKISSKPIPQDDPSIPQLDPLTLGMDYNNDQSMMSVPSIQDMPSFPTPDQPPAPPASPLNNFQNTMSYPIAPQSSGYLPFGQMPQQFMPQEQQYPQYMTPQNIFMRIPSMPYSGGYQVPGPMQMPQFSQLASQLSNLLQGNIDPSNLQGIDMLPPDLLQQLLALPLNLLQLILQIPNILQQQNLLQHLIQNPNHISHFLSNPNQQMNNPQQRFQQTRQQNYLKNSMLPMLG